MKAVKMTALAAALLALSGCIIPFAFPIPGHSSPPPNPPPQNQPQPQPNPGAQ